MNLKQFEEFLYSGIVKKQTPNRERALSLIEEANSKKTFLEISLKQIPSEKMNANFIVDCSYDIIMELIRAKMLLDGFNAGNSHEAEVSYMVKLNFSEQQVMFMNEMRYYRNGTKYYGTILNREYADKTIKFMNEFYSILKKILDF